MQGPLIFRPFGSVSLVVTEIWAIPRKMPRLQPQLQQFPLPTFLGPHTLGCSIARRTLRAGRSSFFIKSSIRRLCSSQSFFISDNILLMDESRVSRCLSETSAPTIFTVSLASGEGFLYRTWSSLKYFTADIGISNCIDKVVLF